MRPRPPSTPRPRTKRKLQAQLASLTTNLNMTEQQYEAGVQAEYGASGATEISSSGWALPTFGLITSGFGMRANPFNGAYQLHDGTDMARGCGQPVYAGHAGTVDYAGWYGALGEFIRIQNDGTYSTGYGHIAAGQILVHEGEQIRRRPADRAHRRNRDGDRMPPALHGHH